MEALDPLEVTTVARGDAEAVRERGGGDPEIVRSHSLAAGLEASPYLRVDSRDRLRDRKWLDAGENVLDERPAP